MPIVPLSPLKTHPNSRHVVTVRPSAANNYGTPIDNVFHQAVNIHLGSGTDHINLDHPAYAGQDTYFGSLRVHGGSGSDNLVLNEAVNLFAIPPVWTSMESIIPAG